MSHVEPSEPPPAPATTMAGSKPLPAWLEQVRWTVNLTFPLVIGALLLFAAVPSEQVSESLRPARVKLGERMRTVSLSQSWNMYAPDPATGHFYMQLYAHDQDGTVRTLPDSRNAEHGWGTVWAWKRDRIDIWHLAVNRHADEANRNRTWFLRGVCLREARLGNAPRRVEIARVFRRIRPPDKVAAGEELLGPIKRTKPAAAEGSCQVDIIRKMIAEDPLRPEAAE